MGMLEGQGRGSQLVQGNHLVDNLKAVRLALADRSLTVGWTTLNWEALRTQG